jgi:large subunit ribosomal protein L18
MKVKKLEEKQEKQENNIMKKRIKKLYIQKKRRYIKKIYGIAAKPRLSIFRSHKHIYAQIIDDESAQTLVYSSTLNKNFANKIISTSTKKASQLVGNDIAKKALEKNIKEVIFDRSNKPYHGRIKSLAEGAREYGLIF